MRLSYQVRKHLGEVIKIIYFEVLLATSPQYCILYLDTANLSVCLELAICTRSFGSIKKKTGKNIRQGK